MINIVTDDNHYSCIHGDIVALLENARRATARSINALMTASYWEIGRRIVVFEQGGQERATYGEALVERLAFDLSQRFGRGFSRQNLWQMRAFHLAWPTNHILQTLSGESASRNPIDLAHHFVARLNDGRLFVVEYKGGDRYSNDDSREKRDIGRVWAAASNGACVFSMVTHASIVGKSVGAQLREALSPTR